MRSERPIPSTYAPKMTKRSVRIFTGNPENGTSMVRMPRRMRVLERDIERVYQGVTMTTNSPRIVSGRASK